MALDLSAYRTNDLLHMINDGDDHGEDFAYHALWGTLFPRWHKGVDLEPLIELLQSEKSSERQRAAWYLDEAEPPAEQMAETVVKLADDPVGNCRWRFVAYVTNSRLYNEIIADRLATCLLDSDLYVRARTIFWAVVTTDEAFAQFTEIVATCADRKAEGFSLPKHAAFWRESERKRAQRGIEIARRLRAGDSIENIRGSIREEDSLSLDYLAFCDRAIKRSLERRARRADAHTVLTGNNP